MSSSGGSPAVRLRTSHSPQSFVRCAPQLLSPVYAHVVDFLFHSYTRSDTVLWLAASPAHRLASSICVRNISSFFMFFQLFSIPYLLPFLPLNLVSRRGFSRSTPRRLAHLHSRSESGTTSRVPLLLPAFRGDTPVLEPCPLA